MRAPAILGRPPAVGHQHAAAGREECSTACEQGGPLSWPWAAPTSAVAQWVCGMLCATLCEAPTARPARSPQLWDDIIKGGPKLWVLRPALLHQVYERMHPLQSGALCCSHQLLGGRDGRPPALQEVGGDLPGVGSCTPWGLQCQQLCRTGSEGVRGAYLGRGQGWEPQCSMAAAHISGQSQPWHSQLACFATRRLAAQPQRHTRTPAPTEQDDSVAKDVAGKAVALACQHLGRQPPAGRTGAAGGLRTAAQ